MLLCGTPGVTLDSPASRQLVVIATAATHSILIPQNVGVFVDDDSYMESFDMAIEIHTLKQRVQEYLVEEMMKMNAAGR